MDELPNGANGAEFVPLADITAYELAQVCLNPFAIGAWFLRGCAGPTGG